jgi:hypothetical protein
MQKSCKDHVSIGRIGILLKSQKTAELAQVPETKVDIVSLEMSSYPPLENEIIDYR